MRRWDLLAQATHGSIEGVEVAVTESRPLVVTPDERRFIVEARRVPDGFAKILETVMGPCTAAEA